MSKTILPATTKKLPNKVNPKISFSESRAWPTEPKNAAEARARTLTIGTTVPRKEYKNAVVPDLLPGVAPSSCGGTPSELCSLDRSRVDITACASTRRDKQTGSVAASCRAVLFHAQLFAFPEKPQRFL